jgi:hypothetical protein
LLAFAAEVGKLSGEGENAQTQSTYSFRVNPAVRAKRFEYDGQLIVW